MSLTVDDLEELYRLLEENVRWRTRFGALLFGEHFDALPARFDRLTQIIERLAEAQERTEVRLGELEQQSEARWKQLERLEQQSAERWKRLERLEQQSAERWKRLERLEQQSEARWKQLEKTQQRTGDQIQRLSEEVRALVSWQRGEAGRREGERYERLTLKRAPALFNEGQGGPTDTPVVQQRLMELLASELDRGTFDDIADPFLADIIWWKDDHVFVVEASVQVNGHDVERAARRAETLRRSSGLEVTGFVIGDAWSDLESREQAKASGVEWKVNDDLSDGFLAFRRLFSTS